MPFLAPLGGLIAGGLGALGGGSLAGGIGTALGVGGSALSGALANRGGKSTTSPTLSPEFAGLQSDLISRITKRMADPGAGLDSVSTGLKSGVNQKFSTLPQRLTTSLAKRGFAQSGQVGQGFKGLELARMQELGDVDAKIAELMLGREDANLDLASRLLALGRGSTTETSGNMLGGAVGAGTETLTTMLLMNKLLGGSGGGGSPAVNYGGGAASWG